MLYGGTEDRVTSDAAFTVGFLGAYGKHCSIHPHPGCIPGKKQPGELELLVAKLTVSLLALQLCKSGIGSAH